MSYLRKRRRTAEEHPEPHWLTSHLLDEELGPIQSLCVEAHEADLVLGKQELALTLEPPGDHAHSGGTGVSQGARGSGLIKWDCGKPEDAAWVDRFDVRLLLSELPVSCSVRPEASPEPGSPLSSTGWSDLPSDSEDAFFLSPSEIADMRYTKRRRMLEEAREERLAALRASGDDTVPPEQADPWGGSDEEPTEEQTTLMERTAAHLHASPDRTRLTARILANHGADKRFAFLRGRWHRAWLRAQAKAAADSAAPSEEQKKATGASVPVLSGLADYGDSDEDVNEGEGNTSEISLREKEDEAVKMEARRARAREWIAKRRAEKKSDA